MSEEGAAAVPSIQHRDLPEAVADLRERVARLEAAQATLGSGDEIARLTGGEQQPPRGWLTEEMRDDLDEALEWLNCQTNVFAKRAAAAIATTLARSTPPRVKMPPGIISALPHEREQQWIAAIRAAGGEVEEC